MRKINRRIYKAVLDVAITAGRTRAKDRKKNYNASFYAAAAWEVFPWMRQAPVDDPVCDDALLLKSFWKAMRRGDRYGFTRDLNKIRRRAKRAGIVLPARPRAYPMPADLAKAPRVPLPKKSRKGAKSKRRMFAEQVDALIAQGISYTHANAVRDGLELTYDAAYFAQALWRAKKFLTYARYIPKKAPGAKKAKALREDLLDAVRFNERGSVRHILGMIEDFLFGKPRLRHLYRREAPDDVIAVRKLVAELARLAKRRGVAPVAKTLPFITPSTLLN